MFPGSAAPAWRSPICRFLWRSAKPPAVWEIFWRWWSRTRSSTRARPRTKSRSIMKCCAGDRSVRGAGARRAAGTCARQSARRTRICWTPRRFPAAMWMRRWRVRRTSSSTHSRRSRSIRRFSSRKLAWLCRRAKASRFIRRARARSIDQQQIARILNLPPEDVEIALAASGGAFGAKEELSIQAQTALAAYLLQPPGEDGSDAQAIHAASTSSAIP